MATTGRERLRPDASGSWRRARQAARRPGPVARFRRNRDTPRRLRWARAVLVALLLACGGGGVYEARARITNAREIARHTAPLTASALELHRTLADADATVAIEFLSDRAAVSGARARYDRDIRTATVSLIEAANQVGSDRLAFDRTTDIAVRLAEYVQVVEQARADARSPLAGGEKLRRASDLMRKTILRRAETLRRSESQRLREQYERAGSVPAFLLVLGAVTLATLGWVQLSLVRKTNRVVNLGLAAATALVIGALAWWTSVLTVTNRHVEQAERHSRAVADGLGQAQIAANQARASELLRLFGIDPETYELAFSAQTERIARNGGSGGALGAARRFVSEGAGLAHLDRAVRHANTWVAAYKEQRDLLPVRPEEAVASALDTDRTGTAQAFEQLDASLSEALAHERRLFQTSIDRWQDRLGGLVEATAFAAVVSAAGVVWGLGRRLDEYR